MCNNFTVNCISIVLIRVASVLFQVIIPMVIEISTKDQNLELRCFMSILILLQEKIY